MAEQRVLGERYELGDRLGRGGMAEVRSGVDLRLGRAVAVKLLNGDLAANPIFRTRFRREALAAASLSHPCIVAVFDSGEEDDPVTGLSLPYIVMELVEGETLRALLAGEQQLAPERALEVTRDVLDALSHSHESGIIHRDIKPANVMLTATGDVKVMDFGIARAASDTSTDLTLTAAVIGTAQYLSPEQARGESVDQRSDVYSTGCLLYEMLAGRPPFIGETALSLVYQHVREVPAPPSRHNPLILPGLDAVTLKALAKDPAARYQSARQMREDIDRILSGGQPTAAVPAELASGAVPSGAVPSGAVTAGAVASVVGSGSAAAAGVTAGGTPPMETPLEPEPDDAGARRRTGGALLVAALVLLLISAGGYGLYLALSPGPAAAGMVSVPDVVGSTRAQAESTLRNAQLTPRVQQVTGKDDKTVNTVVRQTPGSGNDVQADSVITLDVNVGVDTAVIPNGLIGHQVATVLKELKDAGFTNVRTEQAGENAFGAAKDEVVRVDPAEGTSVALAERITVTVAGGQDVSVSPPATNKPSPTARPPSDTTAPSDPNASEPSSRRPSESRQPSESRPPTRSSEPSESSEPDPTPTTSKPADPDPEPSPPPEESSEPVDTPKPTESSNPVDSPEPAESVQPGGSSSSQSTESVPPTGSADGQGTPTTGGSPGLSPDPFPTADASQIP